MMKFALFIVLYLGFAKRADGASDYSITLETALRTLLYTGYEVLQRPSKTVEVQTTLNMITINSLDIKAQALSISAYFTMEWNDSRLAWSDKADYTNVPFLFSNEANTWRPAVIIENSVSDLTVLSDEHTLMRINSQGIVTWTPGGVYETNCEADVTYYPLDTQECSLILSTWAYTSGEVDIVFPPGDAVQFSNFKANGEWEIKRFSKERTTGRREEHDFARLYYTVTLRRRPLFHILNTLFPVILMASLTVFVFKLPPESGERIALSLTVLLSYAVYLTLIAENIPQISLTTSILSVYLTIIFMISTLSVIFTVVVLDVAFNHEDEEEVPEWAQKLTRYFMAPIACWHVKCCGNDKKVSPATDEEMESVGPTTKDQNSNVKISNKTKNTPHMNVLTPNMNGDVKTHDQNLEREASSVPFRGKRKYTWKEIALIMDRCFMYIFIVLVIVPSIVCLALMVAKYSEYD